MTDHDKPMSMVERVARAICAALEVDPGPNLLTGKPRWHGYIPAARAAISAMREPTEGMRKAAGDDAGYYADSGEIEVVYRKMIDAALTESK